MHNINDNTLEYICHLLSPNKKGIRMHIRHDLNAPFRQIMDDFALARRLFTDDEALANIDDVLRLSQVALFDDANQLIPQILGRLKPNKVSFSFSFKKL